MSAPATDPAAEAEFRRVVETAGPVAAPARLSFATGGAPAGRQAAGSTAVDLPPGYRDTTRVLTLRAPDGETVQVRVGDAALAEAFPPTPTPTPGVFDARPERDEAGQPFAFELPPAPAAESFDVRSAPDTAERIVGGLRVVVQARGADPAGLARRVLETLK